MKLKLTRWFLPSLMALFLTLFLVTPCLAAMSWPDDMSIDGVWVYRNCREDGDQLYIVAYTIAYNTTPSETATEAYMVRLMDGSTTLGYKYPYAYHNKGYDKGVVAIYFSSADPPDWEQPYEMQLMGNPFSDWIGGLPSSSTSSFDVWQDNEISITKGLVASRIIYLANQLEADWGVNMVAQTDTGKDVLSSYATSYFTSVLPYLSEIAPDVLAQGQGWPGTTIPPELPPEQERTDYADSLEANIIGTPLDLTPVANIFGVSRGAMTAILYYGLVVVCLVLVARRIGSYRPVMLFGGFLMIVGSFVGVPLMAAILGGLMGLLMIGYTIFYKQSSA